MDFPQSAKVAQAIVRNASVIRKGFNEAFDVDAIVTAWENSHPDTNTMTTSVGRSWATAHVYAKKKPLELALASTYAFGWTLGESTARSRLLAMYANKSVAVGSVDWSTWTPGMNPASALVKPPGGLQALMDSRKVPIADDIIRTKIDRIGTALANGLERGYGPRETAKMINEVVNDPAHALVIARTETIRALSIANRQEYEKNNVQQVEWIVAEGCEDCQENADASPIGIDETFPSGDSEPPAHPNCVCALAPYYDDSDLPPLEEGAAEDFIPEEVATEPDYENLEPVTDAQDVMDYMNQQREAGFEASASQVEAIADYTSGSGLYGEVNTYLREGAFDRFTGAQTQAKVMETIQQLDSVIAEAPALVEDTLTYRGIWGQDAVEFFTKLQPGAEFSDAGFVSTSLNPQIAKNFARFDKANGGVLLEIVNPAGTKGIFPLALRTEVTPQFVTAVGENEWLLPRGATFEVVSVVGRIVRVIVK